LAPAPILERANLSGQRQSGGKAAWAGPYDKDRLMIDWQVLLTRLDAKARRPLLPDSRRPGFPKPKAFSGTIAHCLLHRRPIGLATTMRQSCRVCLELVLICLEAGLILPQMGRSRSAGPTATDGRIGLLFRGLRP
jgi:hypothetical protein